MKIDILKTLMRRQYFAIRPFSLTTTNMQAGGAGGRNHVPSNMEKRYLVWTGRFKSVNEVPNEVSYEIIDRCYNKLRIKVANIMIIGTIVGCILMVISGKNAAARGETLTKQNEAWHKKYNELNPPTK